MGESPRWHDGRFWMCDWLAGEVLAFSADGRAGRWWPGSRGCRSRSTGCPTDGWWPPPTPAWSPAPSWRRTARPGSRSTRSSWTPPGSCWVDMPGSMPWEEPKPGIVAVVRPDGTLRAGGRRRVVPERHGDHRRDHPGRGRVARRPADRVDHHADRRRSPTAGSGPQLGEDEAPDGICVDARGAIWYASVPGSTASGWPRAARCWRRSRRTAAASRACSAATTAGRCTSWRTTTVQAGASDGVVLDPPGRRTARRPALSVAL